MSKSQIIDGSGTSILDKIVVRKWQEIEQAKKAVSVQQLEQETHFNRNGYVLKDFIFDENRTGIIAEFKRQSPSKGIINNRVTVTEVTQGYANAGASALSVLTDQDFFGGHKADLLEARSANNIPILRKDFMLDEYQLLEAKSWGADIVLLIAAILEPQKIKHLAAFAKNLGLNVLLEVHNLEELQRSICDDLDAIGVNNRNLADFSVSVEHSYNLVDEIPDRFLKVSESGISDTETIKRLKNAGYDGFLIGENFMKTDDPATAIKNFVKELL